MEGGDVDTPPRLFCGTPPPLSASTCSLPREPATRTCHGTGHGAGAPLDRHLGGGQAGPWATDREAVNHPSRRRRGGRALGELLQQLKTIGRRVEPAGRAQEVTIAHAVIAFSSRAISWRMSGSALVGPAGSAGPWPSPSRVQCFSTGAARSAAVGGRRGRPVPCWLPFPTCQAAERTAPGGNRRRRLLPAGVLPVRCCPEPTAGRPREHSGPSGSRAACGPRQRHGKRARALRQCVTVEAARFPPRFGRRKRRPHGPQASSLLILIHDDRNRQKWLTPSGKSS